MPFDGKAGQGGLSTNLKNSPSQYWHLMTYCDSRRSDHPFTKSITCGELVCLSFIGCDNFECLYIPYTCPEESFDAILGGTDTVGAICFWDKPYVPEELDPNESWSDDQVYIDDKDVVYTVDRKRLLYARCGFTDNEYAIPEGTLTICDHAFLFHEDYLVLYVPASIKVIGDDIFGKEGGKIVFRDRYS